MQPTFDDDADVSDDPIRTPDEGDDPDNPVVYDEPEDEPEDDD